MIVRLLSVAALLLGMSACDGGSDSAPAATPTTQEVAAPASPVASTGDAAGIACRPALEMMALEDRTSPYDSTLVTIGGETAKLCYGRPSMRGREIYGGLVPYDTLWRTGANEPTTIHLPFAAEIAGIAVAPGSYTLYTVPGRDAWTIIVNRSTTQWGIESQYTDAVRAQEVGRARVAAEPLTGPEEVFTIGTEERSADTADLVLEWENTRVRIPIRRV